jgi:hypothetical protein
LDISPFTSRGFWPEKCELTIWSILFSKTPSAIRRRDRRREFTGRPTATGELTICIGAANELTIWYGADADKLV